MLPFSIHCLRKSFFLPCFHSGLLRRHLTEKQTDMIHFLYGESNWPKMAARHPTCQIALSRTTCQIVLSHRLVRSYCPIHTRLSASSRNGEITGGRCAILRAGSVSVQKQTTVSRLSALPSARLCKMRCLPECAIWPSTDTAFIP